MVSTSDISDQQTPDQDNISTTERAATEMAENDVDEQTIGPLEPTNEPLDQSEPNPTPEETVYSEDYAAVRTSNTSDQQNQDQDNTSTSESDPTKKAVNNVEEQTAAI